jgi:hypothetical protein
MNEEPKSIWKKSFTGWGWLWAWLWTCLILLAAIFIILLIVVQFIPDGPKHFFSMLSGVGIYSLVVSTGVIALFAFARGFVYCCRHFKRFLFGLACLATLIALAYAEEDWRGWHAWNQFKHEWEAKGEKFDWQSVVPPPVPDDQNFAMAPVWVELMTANFGTNLAQRLYGETAVRRNEAASSDRLQMTIGSWGKDNSWPAIGNWEEATVTDLKPWQSYYRELAAKTNEFPVALQPQTPEEAILLALSKYDSTIAELREAAQRPYSRFPLNYDNEDPAGIILPHISVLKRSSQVLQLRAIAELQNGQNDKAWDDVKLSFHLIDSIHTEPVLICHLVRIAMLQITLQPIYEGLAEHKWSDAQLVELDTELAKLNFVADYCLVMRGEMGFQDGMFKYLRRHPEQLSNMSGNFPENHPPLLGRLLVHLIPGGWFYQNQLHCARPVVEFVLPVADASQQTISPEKVNRADATITAQTRRPNAFNVIERLMLPSLGNSAKRFAYGQAAVDLAHVAIALERYRLAHGDYSESLDALAPQFIEKVPHDVIGGKPLHYRRTSDPSSQSSDAASIQFVLYSVGWNGRDDGGVVVFTKGSTRTADINQGDWVWRYPQK